MITAQVEDWFNIKDEVAPLWTKHYEEVGQNKEKMKLNPDIVKCDTLASFNKLHITTVRKDGKIVGYHAGIVEPLLHYKDVLACDGDLYWVDPECRGMAGAAIKLFEEVERSLKARGVKVIYDITKLYADNDRLLQHLGYKPIERRYSKWIGD